MEYVGLISAPEQKQKKNMSGKMLDVKLQQGTLHKKITALCWQITLFPCEHEQFTVLQIECALQSRQNNPMLCGCATKNGTSIPRTKRATRWAMPSNPCPEARSGQLTAPQHWSNTSAFCQKKVEGKANKTMNCHELLWAPSLSIFPTRPSSKLLNGPLLIFVDLTPGA